MSTICICPSKSIFMVKRTEHALRNYCCELYGNMMNASYESKCVVLGSFHAVKKFDLID